MTHFIYPGVAGFADAGGDAGPPADYNADPNGDPAVAAQYMKLAGYPRGTYTGSTVVRMVAASTGSQPVIAHIVTNALTALGFHTQLTLVNPGEMYSKYCAVAHPEVDVCPSVGWTRDFSDPATVLEPTFHGPETEASRNADFGQVDDPAINAAITPRGARARSRRSRASVGGGRPAAGREGGGCAGNVQQPGRTSRAATSPASNAMWNGGTWDFDFTSLK